MSSAVEIKVGDEIRCDRAILAEDRVLIRRDGVWIELRPPQGCGTVYVGPCPACGCSPGMINGQCGYCNAARLRL